MYVLVIIAFLIYITKVPERWFVGKVDFAGHSHNWWHLFVLAALYYWHNSGKFTWLLASCLALSSRLTAPHPLTT
jgi:predicted membrane channel-forming protein YqfA (hemolysin III family)